MSSGEWEVASSIEQPAPPVTVSVRYLDWPDASAMVRNCPVSDRVIAVHRVGADTPQ